MKKIWSLMTGVVLVVGLAVNGYANETVPKPKLNLDARNVIKASTIVGKNRELFQNRELLERIMRLSRTLKKQNNQ